MGLFRRKKKLHLTNIRGTSSYIKVQDRDFPLIELKFEVVEDDTNGVNEVIILMNLWEAGKVANELLNAFGTASGSTLPRQTPRIPWE